MIALYHSKLQGANNNAVKISTSAEYSVLPNKNHQYKACQRSNRRIAVFSVAIMVAICALVTEAVVSERNAAFERARIEAANLSAGFAEQVRGTLNGVTGAMEFLKKHIEEKGAAFDLAAWTSRVPELH